MANVRGSVCNNFLFRTARNRDGTDRTDVPERLLSTVTVANGNLNPAVQLVKRGLAGVIRHRDGVR